MSLLDLFRRKPKPQTEPMASVITLRVTLVVTRPVPLSVLEPWREGLVAAVRQSARDLQVLDPRLAEGVQALLQVDSSVRE